MARISTYPIDSTPSVEDMVIGTEVDNLDVTKNYRIGDLLALGGNGTVTDIRLGDGDREGTAITISGVFTFLGTGGITTTVSGTTMTIDGSGISAGVTQITAGTNITVNPAGGTGNVTINSTDQYEGTVTNVAYTTNINAFTANVSNSGISPVITLNLNGGSAGQFLQQDGEWATVPGGSSGVTNVNFKTDGTALNVVSNTITSSGTMTGIWQGSNTQYVRGDGDLATFPTNIVNTVTTVDGVFIDLTPDAAVDGAVTITADLSAVDGTDTSGLFLSKDNLWSAPPGGSGGVTQITAGTNVTVSPLGGTGNVTINSTDQFIGTVTGVSGVLPITSSGGTTPAIGINNYTGADGTTAGTKGAVPAPGATDNVKFLKGDGTWADAGGTGTVISITPVADAGTGTAITTVGDITFTGAGGITTSVNSSNEVTITGSGGGSGLWTTVGTDIYNNNYSTGVAVIGKNTAASDTTAALEVSGRISQVDGSYNNFIGFEAGKNNTGAGNVTLGYHSLLSNTTGNYNTAIGTWSLQANIGGVQNTAIGYQALRLNTTGQKNTGLGMDSLRSNISGDSNTSVGYLSMQSNTTGDRNTALGNSALTTNTQGIYNIAIGFESLYLNTTGDYNTALGNESLKSNTTGDYNTALGYNARGNSVNATNQIIIGYNAIGSGDNTVTIGNTSITATHLKGILVLDDAGGTPDATTFLRGDNSWAVPAGGGSTNPAGSDTQVQYNDSSAFGAGAFFTTNKSSKVDVKYELGLVGDTINQGLLKLYCEAGTAHFVGIKGPNHSGANSYTLQLPNTLPNATNQILESDAAGTLSWIPTPSGGGTYTAGTGLTLSGTVFNANVDGTQTVTPNASSATALRTYNVQVDSNDDLVVNVPWLNDNDDTGITAVTLAQGTSTGPTNVLEESITGRTLTLTSNKYAGGNFAGYVPIGGGATTFLRGDGTWVTPTDTVGAVLSVNQTAPGTSIGTPIVVDPTTGNVLVKSMAYDGGTDVGHVPTGGGATTFLRGDGTWVTPTSGAGFVPVSALNNSDIYNVNWNNASAAIRSVVIGDNQPSSDTTASLEVHGRISIVDPENKANTFIGFESGADVASVSVGENTAVGKWSQKDVTSGVQNTTLGNKSLNLNKTGNANIAIGYRASPASVSASENLAIGNGSMLVNFIGELNVAVGGQTLQYLIEYDGNTAIGNKSLNRVTRDRNTALGFRSGQWISAGSNNTFIGSDSGGQLNGQSGYDGNRNIVIGNYAGTNVSTGDDCIMIGCTTTTSTISSQLAVNEIVIGNNAVSKGNNTVVLGNNNVTETHLKGVVVLEGYTYAQLIALTAVIGMKSYRTDVGVGPHLWGGTISPTTGTGVLPVFYDGTNWIYA